MSGIGRDVRIDGRRVSYRQPPLPVEVVAARVERIPREVEVVLVEAPREILGGGADLDDAGVLPRPAQRHRRLVEEQVDGDRYVRVAGLAVRVGDEPHDRRIPLGQGRLRPHSATAVAGSASARSPMSSTALTVRAPRRRRRAPAGVTGRPRRAGP